MASFSGTVNPVAFHSTGRSSLMTELYDPKAFFTHAASLRQTFVHCGRFSTAATRRCPDSISVPVVGAMLSHPLDIFALVGHYPTN